jgi:hypothetical protein
MEEAVETPDVHREGLDQRVAGGKTSIEAAKTAEQITGRLVVALAAAQHSVRGGGPLRDDFERITKRRGKKIAKVAVARKILTLCYYGLRDGEIRCLARRCRPAATAVMAGSS